MVSLVNPTMVRLEAYTSNRSMVSLVNLTMVQLEVYTFDQSMVISEPFLNTNLSPLLLDRLLSIYAKKLLRAPKVFQIS